MVRSVVAHLRTICCHTWELINFIILAVVLLAWLTSVPSIKMISLSTAKLKVSTFVWSFCNWDGSVLGLTCCYCPLLITMLRANIRRVSRSMVILILSRFSANELFLSILLVELWNIHVIHLVWCILWTTLRGMCSSMILWVLTSSVCAWTWSQSSTNILRAVTKVATLLRRVLLWSLMMWLPKVNWVVCFLNATSLVKVIASSRVLLLIEFKSCMMKLQIGEFSGVSWSCSMLVLWANVIRVISSSAILSAIMLGSSLWLMLIWCRNDHWSIILMRIGYDCRACTFLSWVHI